MRALLFCFQAHRRGSNGYRSAPTGEKALINGTDIGASLTGVTRGRGREAAVMSHCDWQVRVQEANTGDG